MSDMSDTKQSIPPSNIESELMHILDGLQGTNKMRACLFNLIIYAKKDSRIEYLEQVAQKVIEKFPSRIIFIIADLEKKDYLDTSVSVLTAESGENQIFCDLIKVKFGGSHQVRVPFVILPHILPDLPIYVLWGEDPTKKTPFWLQIEKFVNRLIFDSETTDNLPIFSHSLLEYIEKCKCDIADLNWARIESWRRLLAGCFHSFEKLDVLQKTTAIHIRYNSEESEFFCHTKIQSLYLQAWLSCQLGWEFKKTKSSKDQIKLMYKKDKGSLEIILYAEKKQSIKPGRILSVEIETEDEVKFSFKRDPENPSFIQIESSTPKSCEIPSNYIFDTEESGQSLVREIFHQGTNIHFIKVLQLMKQMKNKDICE